MANKKILGFALMFLLSLIFSIGSALALDCNGVQGPITFAANSCYKDGARVSDAYCCECAGNWPSWKNAFCDGNYQPPTSGSGCSLAPGGAPGCGNVGSWGSTNINQVVKNKAKANPGTAYMAWCPFTGATPYAREVKDACDCPNLKPAPGTCVTDSCNSCGNPVTKCAKDTPPPPPTCVNECNKGDTKCVADEIHICGNFDNDKCTEWGFKKDCEYSKSKTYYVCEYEDSISYKDVEEGYCKDVLGYNDYCAVKKSTEKISETDCGITDCEDDVYCKYNDVYGKESCTIKGCDEPTGKCFAKDAKKEEKVEECGSYSKTDEHCNGENIVYTEIFRGCEESGNTAYCFEDPNTIVVDECGPDTCEEYTELDIYTKEYVHDEESCVENGYAYCAYDPGDIYDYCLNTEMLEQAYCNGNDHDFKEYDCTTLSGCYEFTFETCETCIDPYDQRCKGTYCNKTGMRYRDYFCGDGACDYYELDMVDSDKDKIDDRCDDCIDADFDGVCDDVDTCVGVFNPTQVDSDNDGYGNACDNDKDNDGYNAQNDCDDWNPEVNPGAPEIPNNLRDDDCNPNTPDKGTYTPRQALWVDIDYKEELIVPGEDLDVYVSVKNMHREIFEELNIIVSIPGYSEKHTQRIKYLGPGETDSELFELRIPNNLRSEYEFMRISVSNDYYKRIIYRELRLPEERFI